MLDIQFFLEDADFRKWILNGDEEAKEKWNRWIENNPDRLASFNEAVSVLKQIQHLDWFTSFEDNKEEVWMRIQNSIYNQNKNEEDKPKGFQFKAMYKWIAAAAVIVLVISAYFIYTDNTTETKNHRIQSNIIKPGTNKATIYLADGRSVLLNATTDSIISLDQFATASVSNGTISYPSMVSNAGKHNQLYNYLVTPVGGMYRVQLSDGTKVWLNAASSLRFPVSFDSSVRYVETEGECYFDVMHNEKVPFVVKTSKGVINVYGTSFNVSSYPDKPLKVSLIKGKVVLVTNGKQKVLVPGDMATTDDKNDISVEQKTAIETVSSWKDGVLKFEDESIESVLQKLSNWYDFNVIYESTITEKFNGSIPLNSGIDQVLDILELTGSVKFEIKDHDIIVTKN